MNAFSVALFVPIVGVSLTLLRLCQGIACATAKLQDVISKVIESTVDALVNLLTQIIYVACRLMQAIIILGWAFLMLYTLLYILLVIYCVLYTIFDILRRLGMKLAATIQRLTTTNRAPTVDQAVQADEHVAQFLHPKYDDLLCTYGHPLRPNVPECLICTDLLKLYEKTLTHELCGYSVHKTCMKDWWARTKQRKCVYCQRKLKKSAVVGYSGIKP